MAVRSYLLVLVLLSAVPIIVHCQNYLCPTTINGISFPNIESLRSPTDYVASDLTGNNYAFNFCGPSVSYPVCSGIANSEVCQNGAGASPKSCGTTLGQIVTASENQNVHSVSFFSTGGSPSNSCTNPRSTNITVTCVPNSPTTVIGAVAESTVIPTGATASCLYLITMQSGAVCPKAMYALDSQQSLILTKLQSLWGTQLGWDGDAATLACNSWAGVTCNQSDSTATSFVVGLQLPSTNLSGPIPDIIGELTTLQTLDLSKNRFNGSIPQSFMQLPDIRTLALNNNALTGSIPEFLQSCPIVSLSLQFNRLSGGLPKSMSLLGYLDHLFLQNNQLTGFVPNFVCILSAYSLQRNEWSCPVPVCCGELGNNQCLPCSS